MGGNERVKLHPLLEQLLSMRFCIYHPIEFKFIAVMMNAVERCLEGAIGFSNEPTPLQIEERRRELLNFDIYIDRPGKFTSNTSILSIFECCVMTAKCFLAHGLL